MLKLMKYEIRSVWWIYLTSGVLILAMSGISRLIYQLMPTDPEKLAWSILTYSAFTGLTVFFIIAAFVLANAVPAVRFYQTVLKDQGYLTFTLPVKRASVYFSKLFTGAIGLVFTALFAVGGIFIAFAGTKIGSGAVKILDGIRESFSVIDLSELVTGGQITVFVITVLLTVLHFLFGTTSVLFCSMCIGQLASGNKLLYSILSFVGINTATSAISSFFSLISQALFIDGISDNTEMWALVLSSFLSVLPSVLITAGCIVASNLILKKHLNLE